MKSTVTTSGGKVALDTSPLAALRKELASAPSKRVHIGVLGGSDARSGDESQGYVPGNAEIGLAHEYGVIGGLSPLKMPGQSKQPAKASSRSLPERSFLRMPIISRLPKAIDGQGRETWRQFILTNGVTPTLKLLGILGEGIVQDAFKTGGFGLWPKLKRATIRRKGSATILVDKAELRQSITSRVIG